MGKEVCSSRIARWLSRVFSGLIHIIGPVVGGTLLIFFTIEQALWIDIYTFLIAVIPLLLIRIPSVKKKEEYHSSL